MRKRAQRKSGLIEDQPKLMGEQKPLQKKQFLKFNKNWTIAFSLVVIFLLILFLNSYFNITSGNPFNPEGDGFEKYYLSGPDPYYNMRLVEQTLYGSNPGCYPFYSENDPLLNYPLGRTGHRAPLMNMIAIGFSRLLIPFMDEIDAVGYAMQFVPALFGALLVFPVYFIGKTLFGRKEGILAAFLVALIPIHLSSGHGSAYTLFDHDSFNLLLFFLTYLFLIKSVKETDTTKSILYALLAGIPLAGLSMTWVEARFMYVMIFIYAVVQMLIDIYTSRIELRVARSTTLVLFTGYLLSLPITLARYGGFTIDVPFVMVVAVAGFGVVYYLFGKKNIPWTLSLPIIFAVGIAGLVFLYFAPALAETIPALSGLSKLSELIYGTGIYGKKVSLTIAEAGTYGISRTVMSFGPALYWLAWAGFLFIAYRFIKRHHRRDYLLLLLIFLIEMWLTGVAGRFINDLVPLVALFSAWFILFVIKKIDYKQMTYIIRSTGGGIHGLRRGIKFLHVFGILFVALIVILPNTYLSFDAAVPANEKKNIFGDLPSGAFGTSLGKEEYWIAAYSWFAEQDAEIEKPTERPAFISWWDYGFYEVAVGEHPTVADNFQDGIPPAANFHTATSEEEAVAILIIRLLEGNVAENNGKLARNVITTLEKHLGSNDTAHIQQWVEYPTTSPSYGEPIAPEYDKNLSELYPVGQQWPMNAVYHDATDLLLNALDEEEITWLYHDLQEATGKSIRYYGVEGYDKQIFNIFAFLADKSLLLVAGQGDYNPEDDFVQVKFITQGNRELSYDELKKRTDEQNRDDPVIKTKTIYKDAYFDTMFYRTYIGVTSGTAGSKSEPNYQLPCMNMKHFYAEYISPYPKYAYYQGKSAVVIAKYYEGAYVDGTVTFMNEPKSFQIVVQKNITHYGTELPIDHDETLSTNGTFHVIVPAGNVTIQVRRYHELGPNAFVMTNVTFNGEPGTPLAPISEDEAMRRSENYTRVINISIQPANINGYVYEDKENESNYNASVDQPLENAKVILQGIKKFDPDTGQPLEYDMGMIRTVNTDADGYYQISDLLPGYYQIIVENADGYQIENTLIALPEGNTSHNISQPKPGGVEGTVYFDENQNGKYDSGEELNNVNIDIFYTTTGDDKHVGSLVTDETGTYSFTSLLPGNYRINVTKLPDYKSAQDIVITENETKIINISIEYATITVSGVVKDNQTLDAVGNISLAFVPDASVENNTAQSGSATSDENGQYTIHLLPGTYNVTVNQKVNVSGEEISYVYTGKLYLQVGEGTKTFDILLAREE